MNRVAVIKKHGLARKFIAEALRECGHDVREFDHPERFLESVEERPDCIVTGVWFDRDRYPSGVSLVGELGRQGACVPVVVFSFMKEYDQEVMDAGAYAFVFHNSYDFTELANLVSKAIASAPSLS